MKIEPTLRREAADLRHALASRQAGIKVGDQVAVLTTAWIHWGPVLEVEDHRVVVAYNPPKLVSFEKQLKVPRRLAVPADVVDPLHHPSGFSSPHAGSFVLLAVRYLVGRLAIVIGASGPRGVRTRLVEPLLGVWCSEVTTTGAHVLALREDVAESGDAS